MVEMRLINLYLQVYNLYVILYQYEISRYSEEGQLRPYLSIRRLKKKEEK